MAKKKKTKSKRGVHLNDRDHNGWRIPRTGTLSRRIYDRVVSGASTRQIAVALNVSIGSVQVLSHRFRNPDWASQRNV